MDRYVIFRLQVFEASIVSLSVHLSLQLGFCDDSLEKQIQIISDSAKAIAGNATKHAIRVNVEAERQESKRVEDDKTEKKKECIAKWEKVI